MISNKTVEDGASSVFPIKSSYFCQICINVAVADNTVRPEGILKILYFTAYTEPTRSN